MPYTTRDIRNLALVGQAGAGKTLMAEALLAQSGAIRTKGSLARGTTVCDFDPQEKAQLHSLDAAICGHEWSGTVSAVGADAQAFAASRARLSAFLKSR